MKIRYLIGAVFITVMIIIIAFQNIATRASFYLFFGFESTPLTFPLFIVGALGMLAGMLYAVFIQGLIRSRAKEQDENTEQF